MELESASAAPHACSIDCKRVAAAACQLDLFPQAAERRVEQGGGAPAQAPKVYEMEELLKALKEGPRAPNPE